MLVGRAPVLPLGSLLIVKAALQASRAASCSVSEKVAAATSAGKEVSQYMMAEGSMVNDLRNWIP